MTVTIDHLFVKKFESNLRHLAQQGVSKLRPWCIEKTGPSEGTSFPRIGTHTMIAKTTRQTATPVTDTPFSDRIVSPSTYHDSDVVEHEDEAKMLVDPRSGIAQALAMAARRQFDQTILDACDANATDKDGATVTFASESETLGGATTAFDFSLVTQVQEQFLENYVDPEEEKVFVISPNCVKKMLAFAQATSSDYVNAKALADTGYVSKWMGFTWICSNLLPLAQAETLQRYCFAFTRKAIGLLVSEDIWARVAEDPSISFATRIYTQMSIGAVRIEGSQIIRVHVLES